MGSRKVNTEDIDEELLIASIGRRTQDGNTGTSCRSGRRKYRRNGTAGGKGENVKGKQPTETAGGRLYDVSAPQ